MMLKIERKNKEMVRCGLFGFEAEELLNDEDMLSPVRCGCCLS